MPERKAPPSWFLSLVFVGLGALFSFAIIKGLQENPSQPSAQTSLSPEDASLEGKHAPLFSLPDLKGKTVQLSDYQGKIVFLNFWATWCEPCKEELPSMLRLREKLKDKPFEIIGISLDKAPQQDVPTFAQKYKLALDFPILQDPDQKTAKNLYHTTGVPESYIIGADGKVIKHVIGSYEWDNPQITAYFEELLAKL